jgi:hypothetical protein
MGSIARQVLIAGLSALIARAQERRKTAAVRSKLDLVQQLLANVNRELDAQKIKASQVESLSKSLQAQVDALRQNESFLLLSAELGQILFEAGQTS